MEKNRINIFENKYKNNETSPYWKGYATVNGTEYEVALWTAKNGNGYSGEIYVPKPKSAEAKKSFSQPPQDTPPPATEKSYGAELEDDDIPF